MPRRVLPALVVSAVLALSACGGGGGGGDQSAGTGASPATTAPTAGTVVGNRVVPPLIVGDLVFTDYSAEPAPAPFPLKAAPGKLLVLYFGYLSCPDICPTTMSDISVALKRLPPEDRARVEMAMATIDPERDTGEKMAGFVDYFVPDGGGHGLVAPNDSTLWSATSRIGVEYKVDPHEPGAASYGVAHTGYQYVVDDQGNLIWAWPYGVPGKDLAATLTALLNGTAPTEGPTITSSPTTGVTSTTTTRPLRP